MAKIPKILLVDVDSTIPNLALMKLSTHYKAQGFTVDLMRLKYKGFKAGKKRSVIDAAGYTSVFVSIIFTTNKDVIGVKNCEDVQFGGTGYDLTIKLPDEIDNCEEDYQLYGEREFSYGFITRGCIRNCSFCFVPKKEGMIHLYRTVDQIVKHKKVKFMDNNILAHPEHEAILQEIVDKKIRCQFNQGLDLRLLTEKNAELLSKIKYIGEYFFAFDFIGLKSIIAKNYKLFQKYVPKDWRARFYVYCNAETPIEDVIYRVEWCRQNKALVYFMRDKNCENSEHRSFYSDVASYCNNVALYKKFTFNQFMKIHSKSPARIIKHIQLYGTTFIK